VDPRLANVVIAVVMAVWVINFAAQFWVQDYHPEPTIHAIFTAIVGGAFALKKKNNNNKDRGDRP
jgi:RsiW-degrading membrane proteinase PrsW (M82 family)